MSVRHPTRSYNYLVVSLLVGVAEMKLWRLRWFEFTSRVLRAAIRTHQRHCKHYWEPYGDAAHGLGIRCSYCGIDIKNIAA